MFMHIVLHPFISSCLHLNFLIVVQSQDPRVSITNTVPDRLSLENLINQNVILVEVVQGKPLTMDCEVENRPEETSVSTVKLGPNMDWEVENRP